MSLKTFDMIKVQVSTSENFLNLHKEHLEAKLIFSYIPGISIYTCMN